MWRGGIDRAESRRSLHDSEQARPRRDFWSRRTDNTSPRGSRLRLRLPSSAARAHRCFGVLASSAMSTTLSTRKNETRQHVNRQRLNEKPRLAVSTHDLSATGFIVPVCCYKRGLRSLSCEPAFPCSPRKARSNRSSHYPTRSGAGSRPPVGASVQPRATGL